MCATAQFHFHQCRDWGAGTGIRSGGPKQTLADNGATSFLTKPLDQRLLVGCLAPEIVTM